MIYSATESANRSPLEECIRADKRYLPFPNMSLIKRSIVPVWAIVSCFIVLFPSFLFSQSFSDINRLRQREIADVKFIGNNQISSAELQSVIATHVAGKIDKFLNGIYSEWGAPPEYIDETIQGNDTLVLFQYYRSLGYLDAKIKFSIHESKESILRWQEIYDKNKRLPMNLRQSLPNVSDTVIFYIYEGKQYTVDLFTFEGIERLPADLLKQITENISIKRGGKYSRQVLLDEIVRVKTILQQNGYPFFTVPKDSAILAQLDTAHKKVKISAVFIPGPRIKNGSITISYDTAYADRARVSSSIVRKQIYLNEGDWYRASDQRASEEHLSRLGTFEILQVRLDTSRYHVVDSIPDGATLPISVFLRPRKRFSLTPGIFVGSPIVGKSWIFGITANYSNNNLFLGADNFVIDGSYQLLPRYQTNWSVGGQLTFPTALLNQPLILGGTAKESSWDSIYTEVIFNGSIGSNILLSKGTIPRIIVAPDITAEYVKREIKINDSTLTQSATDPNFKQPQFTIPLTLNFTFDWTNNFFNPTSGSILSAAFQTTTPNFASLIPTNLPSADYNKATLQYKTYLDLSDNQSSIFAFRFSAGWIWLQSPNDSLKNITFDRRFFGGGSNSMRGWPARNLLVSYDQTKDRPILGGYTTYETNLEWRYAPFQFHAYTSVEQFIQSIRLALFTDIGNVWDKGVTPTFKTLAMDMGIGFRLDFSLLILRLDIAKKVYNPNPNYRTDHVVAALPDATGEWIFSRPFFKEWQYQVAIGQPF